MLAENLLLSLAAAILGLQVAWWCIALVWSRSAPIFRLIGVEGLPFDHRVVVFTVLLVAVTMALFGVIPAVRRSRVDVVETMKDGGSRPGGGRRRGQMSRALVTAQVALSVTTLIVSALMLRSFVHFSYVSSSPGFDPRPLFMARLPQAEERPARPASWRAALEEIERRVAAEPGVERVALTSRIPFLEAGSPAVLSTAGSGAGEPAGERMDADARSVSPGFFRVMSIRLLEGRTFDARDSQDGQPVAIVDERLARTQWRGANPVGARILVDGTWRTVVGVVASNIQPSPFRPSKREVFLPYLQAPPAAMTLVARSRRPPGSLAAAIRRLVRSADPDQPLVDLQSMPQALDNFMTPFRLLLSLIASFGAIALLLAAVGLYSVISHGVTHRAREIGVRMALGAGQSDVVRMVVREGLRPATIGVATGLLLGLALAVVLPSEILGVTGLAVAHYVGAVALWFLVALVACLIPARRAARVNMLDALRCD